MSEEALSMYRARLIRLYPTADQEARLSSWVGAVRFVYNLALEQRRTYYRPGRRFNYVTQNREVTALRQSVDWLADVPSGCLTHALRELDQTYRHWWAGYANAPGFRRAGQNDSFRIPKPSEFKLRSIGRKTARLKLPKIGEIACRLDGPLAGEPRNVTVSRRGGQWFAAVTLKVPAVSTSRLPGRVGIDRGIRVFAALSSGDLIEGPNVGRRAAKALARAQRNLSRKQKGSRNRNKQRLRVAKLHMRIANIRKDFVHKVSASIAKSHGVVVLEDLRIGNMTRSAKGDRENPGRNVRQKSGLNRSILDQGWGMFHRFLAYKLAERGGELILVPAKDTSRTCAACGVVDKESRKADRFTCTACGHEADADLNAAINILRRGRTSVLPVEGGLLETPVEAGTSGRAA